MEASTLFKALQQKIRFTSSRGLLNVEDLFELPLTSANGFNLDAVSKTLLQTIKEESGESLVQSSDAPAKKLSELKLEVLKEVIKIKQEAAKAKAEASAKSSKKQALLEALSRAQDTEMSKLSVAELQAQIAELDS